MTQGALFDLDALPVRAATWRRDAGALGKLDTVHVHVASGWSVEHCGHPTANFPYLVWSADGERHLAPNGRGFQNLKLAKSYVEQKNERGQ